MPMIGNKLFSPESSLGKTYPSDDGGGGGKVFRGSVLSTNHPQYINSVNKKSRANSGGSQTQNMIETTEIIMNNNRIQSSVMDLGKKLLQCARDNDIVGVEIMMRKGAPFAADWLGMTAIHFAAMNDRYDICKLLVTSGINKDARTKVDRTPLHLAAFYGHERIAQLLIENQCTINPRDMLRMTPLHWAVEKRHKSIVRLLLKYNADVTAISKFGKTPIALAVLTEQADILQELEAAKQIQQSRKFNEQHEKETNEAVNSITGLSKDDDEPVCKKSKMAQDHEKPIKTNSRLSIDHFAENIKEEKLHEHSAVNLLKSHGISIMKDDEDTSNNLLTTALQNGRQLVLSEGGKLLLDEARRMANNKNSDLHKASPSSQHNTTVGQIKIKTEAEAIVQMSPAAKFRPNIITKIKDFGIKPTISMKIDSPNNNNDKSTKIRVMSMHDFRKLCGTGNVKSVQRIDNSMNKSQLVKLKEEDKKILAHRPSIEENKKLDPIILEDNSENDGDDDEENDLPPNIIKVSAKSDQEYSSDNDEPHTAVMYPPIRQSQEPRLVLTRQPPTTNTSRITFTRSPSVLSVSNTKLERTPVIPLLTVPEICRQLLELRKQNDELRRKYEIVQKEKEDFRNRLERLESLLLVEQTEEDYTQM